MNRSAWIVSPRYDLTFFIGSLLLPLLLWAAFQIGWLTGVGVFVIFQLAFNMPHNIQTWTMSVLDEDDRKRNATRYILALVVITLVFALPMMFSPNGVLPWIRDALIYWGYYHAVRQHYGFARLYERRSALAGERIVPLESKFYARFLDVVAYAPLVLRFRDKSLMTIRVAGKEIWVRHPVLPELVWKSIAAIYALIIVVALVHHAVSFAKGRRQMLPRALLLLAVTVASAFALIIVNDVVVAIAIVTSFHNLQYLGLVLFHNRNRARAESAGGQLIKNWAIGLLRDGKFLTYAGITFLYGIVLLVPIALLKDSPLGELPITVAVAMHYYVDSRIWRFQDYPNLGRYLGIAS